MAYYEGEISGIGSNNGGNSGWGADGAWWIIILLIFGYGGFGRWGGANDGGGTTVNIDSAMQRGFDTQSIISKLDGINHGLCDGFYAQNTNLLQGFSGLQQGIMQQGYESRIATQGLSAQLASCCCDLKQQIGEVNYNMSRNTCDIIRANQDNTQRIIDYMTSQQIQNLRDDNFALRLSASQVAQNNYLIESLRPVAKPAYITCSPYQSAFGFGYGGCGGNCGCGGTNIQ